jgi:LysM repeat protein
MILGVFLGHFHPNISEVWRRVCSYSRAKVNINRHEKIGFLMRKISCAAILFTLFLFGSVKGDDPRMVFPVSGKMKLQVQFWVNVFTRYSIYQKIIHDASNPLRIYSVVDFREYGSNGNISREKRNEIVRREKQKIAAILKKLASKSYSLEELPPQEARIYRLFGKNPGKGSFTNAIRRIHIQGGMKEAFVDGLNRSGRYLDAIKKIFRDHDLPEELVYLPHIESSFNPYARSRSGALGIWQFTRNTGKSYFNIGNDLDERRDPILASEAAAKLLKHYYSKLGNWPLAVTAYNHGLGGMSRAIRKLNTRDLDTIIANFRSRSFGFASKNFYTEFVAAVRVAKYPWKYFDDYEYDDPYYFRTLELDEQKYIMTILNEFDVTEDEIRRLNPALRPAVLQGKRPIPKDYALRLPADESNSDQLAQVHSDETQLRESEEAWFSSPREWLDFFMGPEDQIEESEYTQSHTEKNQEPQDFSIQENEIESYIIHGNTMVVQPEETLGHYADWLEIPTHRLRNHNGLRYGQRIQVGQNLKVPLDHVSKKEFEERRTAYHLSVRKSFYASHRIEGSRIHEVRRGETLWAVANYRFEIPLWLLAAYNGFRDLNRVKPGEKVHIPIVSKIQMNHKL